MRHLASHITDFELGALCPDDKAVSLYSRLGWQFWRGPLAIRTSDALKPTPDAWLMVLFLPNTPSLDLGAPLSAEWRPFDLW
jgi:aminoglycoside 2'-N-acetyltransferase I